MSSLTTVAETVLLIEGRLNYDIVCCGDNMRTVQEETIMALIIRVKWILGKLYFLTLNWDTTKARTIQLKFEQTKACICTSFNAHRCRNLKIEIEI